MWRGWKGDSSTTMFSRGTKIEDGATAIDVTIVDMTIKVTVVGRLYSG